MPPKAKRLPVAAKVSAATRRKEACITAIAEVFPDFAEDTSFCDDLAKKVLACAAEAGCPDDFRDALEDALMGVDNIAILLADVYGRLLDLGIVKAQETDESEDKMQASEAAEDRRPGGLSEKKLSSIFSKELRKRERAIGDHEVSAAARKCEHSWDSTGAGGMHCQVCNFETKDKSYTCTKGCCIRLCGKCWWKWKEQA